jgi:hypothetical protein
MKNEYHNQLNLKDYELQEKNNLIEEIKNSHKLENDALNKQLNSYKTEINTLEDNISSTHEQMTQKTLDNITEEGDKFKELFDNKKKAIKENAAEIETLRSNISSLEEKARINIDADENNLVINNLEKKHGEDILLFRQKIAEKDEEESINNVKEKLKYECNKLKQEIKGFEQNKTKDEAFFKEISEMQNKYSDRDRKRREDKEDEIKLLKKEIEKLNEKIKRLTIN